MKKTLFIIGGLVVVLGLGYLTHVFVLKSRINAFVEVNQLITESYERGAIDVMTEAIECASEMLERKSLRKYLGETDCQNWADFYKDMKMLAAEADAMSRGGAAMEISSMSGDKYKSFVKTNAKCRRGHCQCSGYWGIKHYNGTYEGSCRNSDGFGHTCGHSPQDHGLRTW